jgi:putative thioredoxin
MSDTPHTSNVTRATFDNDVISASHQVPVLVDYWAEWCGPCQMQMPVLGKLVEEHAGGFLLAKVNTDEERELAREHGIRSLPTMRLYKEGEVVEEILGAQTESTLRVMIERHLSRPSDDARQAARAAHQSGRPEEALALLQEALASDPENHRIRFDCAEMHLLLGQLDEAESMLADLPHDLREEADALRLSALLGFARQAEQAPNVEELEQVLLEQPANSEARYQLAAQHVMAGQPQAAMDELLYIIRHDRQYGDDAGRRGLLALFDLLGNEGELVGSYRRKLFNAMH